MLRSLFTLFSLFTVGMFLGITLLVVGVVHPSRSLCAFAQLLLSRLILSTSGVRMTVEGTEAIPTGESVFFAGNHQSALDIPIISIALRGRVRFLAKRSLFRIPVFGWALWRYGHVAIDRTRPRATAARLDRMLEELARRPISFVVFPEGTRSRNGVLLPFRKGTMKICQRAGLAIVPFSIDGSGKVCRPNELRVRPGAIRIRFGTPIPADRVKTMAADELHDCLRARIAEGLGQLEGIDAKEGEAAATPQGI